MEINVKIENENKHENESTQNRSERDVLYETDKNYIHIVLTSPLNLVALDDRLRVKAIVRSVLTE